MAGPARPSCPVWLDLVVVIATSAILSFGGIGLFLADMGHYSAGLVFPIGMAGTAAATVLARPRAQERARPRRRSWSLTALGACVVALGQLAGNATNMSRHVVGDRDPGLYLLIGKWLAEHGSLVVPVTNLWWGKGIFFSMTSAGVYPMRDGTLQFQFAHMMSVLLAEADNLGGDGLMFVVPAVLGAIGLCAIYAVGCRLVRRPWIVLAAVAGFGLYHFLRRPVSTADPQELPLIGGKMAAKIESAADIAVPPPEKTEAASTPQPSVDGKGPEKTEQGVSEGL